MTVNLFRIKILEIEISGQGGIRTHEGLSAAGFTVPCVCPLRHLPNDNAKCKNQKLKCKYFKIIVAEY